MHFFVITIYMPGRACATGTVTRLTLTDSDQLKLSCDRDTDSEVHARKPCCE